jgi:putative transcriptional regulator
MPTGTTLSGKILIAMPGLADTRFEKSLVFLCSHTENGAMGLIINKTAPMMFFSDIIDQLNIMPPEKVAKLPALLLNLPILLGGPVEQQRGFVLHSREYFQAKASVEINETIALTATTDILQAIAQGRGPAKVMLALGYSGWVAGQLEDEIQRNSWLHCEADEELLFGTHQDEKYLKALRKIGVDPAMLSGEAGHG